MTASARRALLAFLAVAAPAGAQLQPLGPPPVPPGNPITPAKADLGKALFWDEQLSSTRSVSCGTCHLPEGGGSDPRAVPGDPASTHPGLDGVLGTPDDVTGSPGVPRSLANGTYDLDPAFGLGPQVTGRRSQSVVNSAYPGTLFWDGRADGSFEDPLTGAVVLPFGAALESQALGPPVSAVEMAHVGRDWNDVAARVAASQPLALAPSVPAALAAWIDDRAYPALFDEAFGSPDVTPVRIALALATYQRTLVADQTPFDAQLAGVPSLTPLEQQGRALFNALTCNLCHGGNRLTNDQFFYIGVRPVQEDLGRFAVTGAPPDRGAFRVPSLRNVELRAPYFHDGSAATLQDVVDFYDRGGDFNAPNKAPVIAPLGLTPAQKTALVAFLSRPLTDPRVAAGAPPFDRPGLWSESPLVPGSVDPGSPGASGTVPVAVALEPPALGNPNCTLGVTGAPGGAPALLVIDAGLPPAAPFAPALPSFGAFGRRLAGTGPGAGWGSVPVALPLDPALVGTELFARWYVRDTAPAGAAAAFRLAASDAVRLELF